MTPDPIDQLIADGVTARMLIAFHAEHVDWLAARRNDTFRICYHDETGEVVVETLTAAGLVMRAHELGWKPSAEEPTDISTPYVFDEPVYHLRRGVHWYATAADESNAMLPLAWPAAVLSANMKREEREHAAYWREAEAKKRREEKARAKQKRIRNRESMESLISHEMRRANQAGKPISRRLARRRVVTRITEICKGMSKPDAEAVVDVVAAVASDLGNVQDAVPALPPRADMEAR